MHHLARHAVACFLTRGDLWLSWEEGEDREEDESDLYTELCKISFMYTVRTTGDRRVKSRSFILAGISSA